VTFYGNNIGALATRGKLISIPHPGTETITGDNDFDTAAIANRGIFLEEFGVSATYRPGVLNRSITVIVRHEEDDGQVVAGSRHRSPVVNIKAANDSAIGISAEEFEQGQIIDAPPRKGADNRSFRLARIIKQSAAFVTYEVH